MPPDRLEPQDQPAPPAPGSALARPSARSGAQGVQDKPVRAGQHGRPGKPGAEPIVPSPHRRAPARFSWLGIALLGGAVVVALVVTVGIFLPALGALGQAGARDPANLPARISTCGREWTKDALNRTFTRDEILARTESAPIVVATGSAPSCPPEAASGEDADGMATSIYVKVADDAFVAYDLVGAP